MMQKALYNPITPADLEYKLQLPEKCQACIWRRELVCMLARCVKENELGVRTGDEDG